MGCLNSRCVQILFSSCYLSLRGFFWEQALPTFLRAQEVSKTVGRALDGLALQRWEFSGGPTRVLWACFVLGGKKTFEKETIHQSARPSTLHR